MKKIFLTLVIASGLLSSCSTETDNVSTVTNYPTIEVLGADPVFVAQGGTFVDPGVIAKEGTAIIPTTTTVAGKYRGATTLDTNITDQYTITYTATNKDGFKASASRTVIVYKTGDLVNSIEGVYISTVRRNGNLLPASQGSSVNMKYIYIWKNTNGTYGVSDAIGGWYELGRHIGGSNTPGGIINAVNIPTNSFTYPGNPQTNSYFGGTNNITDVNVNAATKVVTLTSVSVFPPATTYNFVSTLTQVQL